MLDPIDIIDTALHTIVTTVTIDPLVVVSQSPAILTALLLSPLTSLKILVGATPQTGFPTVCEICRRESFTSSGSQHTYLPPLPARSPLLISRRISCPIVLSLNSFSFRRTLVRKLPFSRSSYRGGRRFGCAPSARLFDFVPMLYPAPPHASSIKSPSTRRRQRPSVSQSCESPGNGFRCAMLRD